ncbi:MAG TPA: glutathione transferase GstA [Burkholderiaceae bacterium]|nr:glutathione transferase GstA [Burkholderiaceae bacterium]
MKLYYSPNACSLSPHIVLREAGLPFDLVKASTKTHKLDDGTDYYTLNPKGYVPLLELDDGQRLSEGPVIVQYIADKAPAKKLAPAAGTLERYRLQEWLNFITAELHKSFSPLFNPEMPEAAKQIYKAKIESRFKWVDEQLKGKTYLLGDAFSVADAYLFTVTRWSGFVGVNIAGLQNLAAFMERVGARPAVQAALKAENP